jgi:ABC-type Fe3+ transport system substrate-binding protein
MRAFTNRRLSRRTFLAAAASLSVLAACGQTPAAAPASSQAAKPDGSAGGDWQKQWDSWVEGAKKEGKLVLASGPSPDARVQVPAAFKKAFGVDVEYLGGSTSDLANRLRSEQASNQYTLDVIIAGADTAYLVLYGEHLTEPVKPWIINPEALDPRAWPDGKVWYMDPGQDSIVRISNYRSRPLAYNTEFVKAEDVKSWNDLLQPQFKGKIAAYDPVKNGSGGQTSAYLYNTFGPDFVKKLYLDQGTTFTDDYRQLSDWLARGVHPVSIAARDEDIDKLQKDGFKIEAAAARADAAGYVSAGFGLMNLVKNPPHPNAAKLFLNWMAMKDGQSVWASSQKVVSSRMDIKNTWADADIVPEAGVKYFDTYSWDYVQTGYDKNHKAVQQILGK